MRQSRVWQGMAAGLLGLLMSIGLPPGMAVAQHQQTHAHTHRDSNALPPGDFTQDSLYQLASTWTTASGQQMHLGELRGRARVVVMHYTSCEYACPILISRVKRIAEVLPPEVQGQIGFVAITFDPNRDTPDVLKAYGDKMRLDPQYWTLLYGAPDDILELAVLLGVKYKEDDRGGFSHSNLVTVLNKKGEIIHRHAGLHHPITETVAAITQAAQE